MPTPPYAVDSGFEAMRHYFLDNHESKYNGEVCLFCGLLLSIREDVMARGFEYDYMSDMADFLDHVNFVCELAGIERHIFLNHLLKNWRVLHANKRAKH